MTIDDLKDLYVTELQEARSVEDQLSTALPKVCATAGAGELKRTLDERARATASQRDRLDEILERHGAASREHRDDAMQTLIAEADKWAGMIDDGTCRDAALIASSQRIEHYKLAVYGSLATWAQQLGLEDDAAALHALVDAGKAADSALTRLAKDQINPQAAA